jgi:hypothetical protein
MRRREAGEEKNHLRHAIICILIESCKEKYYHLSRLAGEALSCSISPLHLQSNKIWLRTLDIALGDSYSSKKKKKIAPAVSLRWSVAASYLSHSRSLLDGRFEHFFPPSSTCLLRTGCEQWKVCPIICLISLLTSSPSNTSEILGVWQRDFALGLVIELSASLYKRERRNAFLSSQGRHLDLGVH